MGNTLHVNGYLDLICLGMDEIEVEWKAESVCSKQVMMSGSKWSLLKILDLFLFSPSITENRAFVLSLRRQVSRLIDERVKVMNEVISGMRVIKLYTWEDSITQWISKIRM